jgi:hypothetical protein
MLPRGFAADAERRAIALRAELGLGLPTPCPEDLAARLNVGFRSRR